MRNHFQLFYLNNIYSYLCYCPGSIASDSHNFAPSSLIRLSSSFPIHRPSKWTSPSSERHNLSLFTFLLTVHSAISKINSKKMSPFQMYNLSAMIIIFCLPLLPSLSCWTDISLSHLMNTPLCQFKVRLLIREKIMKLLKVCAICSSQQSLRKKFKVT